MGLTERVDAVIDAALGSRIVGCVVLIEEAGKRIYARSAGLPDREAGTPVAVINEAMAHRFWPGRDPLGTTIWMGPPEAMVSSIVPAGFRFPRLTVVGVVMASSVIAGRRRIA